MSAAGWALCCPHSQVPHLLARTDKPVTTFVSDPRAALALLGAGLVQGVLVQSWGQLAGLVELVDQPPPAAGPGPGRRARTSRVERPEWTP